VRVAVPGNLGQKVHETPISTNAFMWWCAPAIPAMWGAQIGGLQSRLAWAYSESLFQKEPVQTTQSWQSGPVVEHLPNKCKTLSSNLSTKKKKIEIKEIFTYPCSVAAFFTIATRWNKCLLLEEWTKKMCMYRYNTCY
jgi:hypothetical protein